MVHCLAVNGFARLQWGHLEKDAPFPWLEPIEVMATQCYNPRSYQQRENYSPLRSFHQMTANAMHTIEQIESQLWEAADQLRANSKLTSSEYCMPMLESSSCVTPATATKTPSRRSRPTRQPGRCRTPAGEGGFHQASGADAPGSRQTRCQCGAWLKISVSDLKRDFLQGAVTGRSSAT